MTEVRSEITANVWLVHATVGDRVQSGDELVVLESMKMEIPVHAPAEGTVVQVNVAPNDAVQEAQVLVVIDDA